MKYTIKVEVEAKYLAIKAKVRFWEDAHVDGEEDVDGELIPCREGDYWCPVIDLDTGQIINWKVGVTARIHYKICDGGIYELQYEDGTLIECFKYIYVPSMLCPNDNGWGDYIIMNVDENGYIQDFKATDEGLVEYD